MPRFYETTLSITNLHNLSISTHVNRSRIYIPHTINLKRKTCNKKFCIKNTDSSYRYKPLNRSSFASCSCIQLEYSMAKLIKPSSPLKEMTISVRKLGDQYAQ